MDFCIVFRRRRVDTMIKSLLISTVIALTASAALAEWSFAPAGNWVSETPTAIGVSVQGAHAVQITCAGGAPFIYTNGYPAKPGDNRESSFSIVVDDQSFQVTGEHSPSDGLWTGAPPPGLIDALRRGRVADVTPEGQSTVRLSLSGSSDAIGRALEGCAAAETSAAPGRIVLTGALIADACRGGYELTEGAELTGLLDGDDQPDIVLDWAGVTCADRSQGRGAGRCGVNMCTISVFLTETQSEQPLLGLKPEIASRGFGRSALRTLALRPSCPDDALECFVTWRWTGTKLEPVR